MNAYILHLAGVRKSFPGPSGRGQLEALHVSELTVRRGEFLAVAGPSGGGKSTLINLIAGFFPPTEGTILKNGNPLHGPGPDRVVVFQKHALFPWFTAFENVAYGLHRRKLPAKDRQTRVEYALNMVGLSDFSQAYPASLSGGMCQRVALARALVLRPDILLLDEPFASLDAVTRIRLQDELLQLWECHGWTVILVTHNLDEAVYMADRVALLYPPPQGLKRVLTVDIPRTRSRNNAKVKEISGRLAQDLGADACNLQLEENPDA